MGCDMPELCALGKHICFSLCVGVLMGGLRCGKAGVLGFGAKVPAISPVSAQRVNKGLNIPDGRHIQQ
jgi:hypothetical protein